MWIIIRGARHHHITRINLSNILVLQHVRADLILPNNQNFTVVPNDPVQTEKLLYIIKVISLTNQKCSLRCLVQLLILIIWYSTKKCFRRLHNPKFKLFLCHQVHENHRTDSPCSPCSPESPDSPESPFSILLQPRF